VQECMVGGCSLSTPCCSASGLDRSVPGISDAFSDELLTAPPEDPAALAAAIDRAWRDDELRQRTAATGYRYARRLGGTPDRIQWIIDEVARHFLPQVKTEDTAKFQTSPTAMPASADSHHE
jgi:hypothetical protein